MKTRLTLFLGFVFLNAMWQAVVWYRDIFGPIVAWALIVIVPIVLGIGLHMLVARLGGRDRSWIFIVGGLLVPLVYLTASFTRVPDFVRFNERPDFVYSGPVADLSDANSDFYEIHDFGHEKPNKAQFGVAYSVHLTRGSGRYYTEHYILPVFGTSDAARPRLWVFGSYPSIYVPERDSDEFVMDGLELKAFREKLKSDVLFGRKIEDAISGRALSEYLSKFTVDDLGVPLVLELIDGTPARYFLIAAVEFWVMTAGLNFIFLSICLLASLKGSKPTELL